MKSLSMTMLAELFKRKQLLMLGLVSGFALLSLGGCSNLPHKQTGDAAEQTADGADTADASNAANSTGKTGADNKGVEVIGAGGLNGQDINGSNLKEGENPSSASAEQEKVYKPLIFFGYNQSEVDDTGVDTAKYYAKILVDNPQESVKLIGNTDERGTPGYNLALGEERAKAVAQVMMLYGVSQGQIEVISMGEENPMVDGHDEDAWAQNRRVEIKIK